MREWLEHKLWLKHIVDYLLIKLSSSLLWNRHGKKCFFFSFFLLQWLDIDDTGVEREMRFTWLSRRWGRDAENCPGSLASRWAIEAVREQKCLIQAENSIIFFTQSALEDLPRALKCTKEEEEKEKKKTRTSESVGTSTPWVLAPTERNH